MVGTVEKCICLRGESQLRSDLSVPHRKVSPRWPGFLIFQQKLQMCAFFPVNAPDFEILARHSDFPNILSESSLPEGQT